MDPNYFFLFHIIPGMWTLVLVDLKSKHKEWMMMYVCISGGYVLKLTNIEILEIIGQKAKMGYKT